MNIKINYPLGIVFALCIAATANAQTLNAEQIRKIVREEIEQMLQSDALEQAIAKGIEDYISNRQAQAAAQQEAQRQAAANNLRPVDSKRDHILGAEDAPVTLIEYSDFECPFCKRFHPTMIALLNNNPDKLRWVYRHFPLSFHNPGAQIQAEASECAAELGGNDAFWKFTDAIYERTTAGGEGFALDNLVPLAGEIGIDETGFAKCLDSGKMTQRVNDDHANGMAAGVSGTPAIFILNNKGDTRILAGALPLKDLQSVVDELLQ